MKEKMNTATIEQLKQVVSDHNRTEDERTRAAEHILKLSGADMEWIKIDDDDPELARFPVVSADTEYAREWPMWAITSLAQAKKALAQHRRSERLLAKVRDESSPMAARIEAAKEWRTTLGPSGYFYQFNGEDLVERLMAHPHCGRLAELKSIIDDRTAVEPTAVDQWIHSRVSALREYRRLFNEYPKRREGTPYTVEDSEERIAVHAARVDPSHGATRDTYCYVLSLLGRKV